MSLFSMTSAALSRTTPGLFRLLSTSRFYSSSSTFSSSSSSSTTTSSRLMMGTAGLKTTPSTATLEYRSQMMLSSTSRKTNQTTAAKVLKGAGEKYVMPLVQEHKVIDRFLLALEGFLRKLEAEKNAEAIAILQAELVNFVIIFEEFIQEKHHGKESQVFIPFLVDVKLLSDATGKKGSAPMDKNVVGMLDTHTKLKDLVKTLKTCSEVKTPWSDVQRTLLLRDGRACISLLRASIGQKEQIIFPQLFEAISQSLLAQLERKLEDVEHSYLKTGTTPRLIRLAVTLDRKYAALGQQPAQPAGKPRKVVHEP